MKYYLCACSVCSWKGNRIHHDGQCPVCGHALKIKAGRRGPETAEPAKVRITGLVLEEKRRLPSVAEAWTRIMALRAKKP